MCMHPEACVLFMYVHWQGVYREQSDINKGNRTVSLLVGQGTGGGRNGENGGEASLAVCPLRGTGPCFMKQDY